MALAGIDDPRQCIRSTREGLGASRGSRSPYTGTRLYNIHRFKDVNLVLFINRKPLYYE